MPLLITTKRLFISVPKMKDIEDWHLIHSDVETMQYLGGVRDRATTRLWLKNDISHYKKYGLCLGSVFEKKTKKTNLLIGIAGLIYLNYDATQTDIEIGYSLRKEYWNKGYATELVQSLIQWGFSHLKVKRLVAVTRPENLKSQAVLEKCGLRYIKKIKLNDKDYLLYTIYSTVKEQ